MRISHEQVKSLFGPDVSGKALRLIKSDGWYYRFMKMLVTADNIAKANGGEYAR